MGKRKKKIGFDWLYIIVLSIGFYRISFIHRIDSIDYKNRL